MAKTKRISNEPAYILHRYDWSESSLILEVFTRHYGRVALVAKGVKRPTSSFRPVLLPLQPLQLSYGLAMDKNSEIHTLKAAEWLGGHVMPTGEALLSGYYLNELLLRLLARDDPHTKLFDIYAAITQAIACVQGEALQPILRTFELLLLREIGLLPILDRQTLAVAALQPDAQYTLSAEGGLRWAGAEDRSSLPGHQWLLLQEVLNQDALSLAALSKVCVPIASALKYQLRGLLHHHVGTHMMRTRKMMVDLQTI